MDDQEKLLGHLGLSFSIPEVTIAELTAAFVDPVCRGRRLLGQLMAEVMAEAEQMGLQGLFVHAVTSHVRNIKFLCRSPDGLHSHDGSLCL